MSAATALASGSASTRATSRGAVRSRPARTLARVAPSRAACMRAASDTPAVQ